MPLDTSQMSPQPLTTVSGPLTAADVVAIIPTWDDVSPKVRRTWRSAVRVLSPALGLPLEAIPMDPVHLNRAMKNVTAATARVSDASFRTYKNSIRQVLQRLGALPTDKPFLTPACQALLDALPDHFEQIGLRTFLGFASSRGLTPEQIDARTIVAYGEYLLTQVLRRRPDIQVRRIVRVWNRFIRVSGAGRAALARCECMVVVTRRAGRGCARDRSWRGHTSAASAASAG